MSACKQFEELYEAFALGALDAGERAAFEAHLVRGCATCEAGVARAREVVAQLAYLAPGAEPPRSIKHNLLAAVQEPKQRRIAPVWLWAAAAAVALFSIYNIRETQRLRRQIELSRQRIDQEQKRAAELTTQRAELEQVLAILRDPATQLVNLKANNAQPPLRAYWHEKAGIVLTAENLPQPQGDHTFQLWVVPKKGNPISAGIFRPNAQGGVVYHTLPAAQMINAAALAITEEPVGGRPQPTTTPIWVGPLT